MRELYHAQTIDGIWQNLYMEDKEIIQIGLGV